jgi:hypothetical protein
MATKREDCTRDKFSQRLDPKYGYFVKDCKDESERRMLVFLVPIFSPEKPYNITLTLANTLILAYSEKKVVDWGSIIGELVHKLTTNTKRGQPFYIGPYPLPPLRKWKPTHRRRGNPMDIASVHAGAPDYQLGAGDGP